jgi:hypothetical protein
MRRAALAAFAVLPLLAACTDPGAPNKQALLAALTADFLDRPPCFATDVTFPYTRTDTMRPADDLQAALPGLVALREAGLIRLTHMDMGMAGRRVVYETHAELTDAGKGAYFAKLPGLRTTTPGFCGGKRVVDAVKQFTLPSDSSGHKVTTVDYTFRTVGLPAWMKDPRLRSYYVSVKKAVDAETAPAADQTLFVRTEKGWLPWNRVPEQ